MRTDTRANEYVQEALEECSNDRNSLHEVVDLMPGTREFEPPNLRPKKFEVGYAEESKRKAADPSPNKKSRSYPPSIRQQ